MNALLEYNSVYNKCFKLILGIIIGHHHGINSIKYAIHLSVKLKHVSSKIKQITLIEQSLENYTDKTIKY